MKEDLLVTRSTPSLAVAAFPDKVLAGAQVLRPGCQATGIATAGWAMGAKAAARAEHSEA